jgi:hypothetical protein
MPETCDIHNGVIINRYDLVRIALLIVLLFSLIAGAGYRTVEIKRTFSVYADFELLVNMASHFWTAPGAYNHEYTKRMKEAPDEYVFSRTPEDKATGSFEHEKGWPFILSIILPEGTRGIRNIALIVLRYQLMLDLLVIVLLFYAGKAIAGPLGGAGAALLYALFKPAMTMVSWVVYYYWAIPFSALSIFFWAFVYDPERKPRTLSLMSAIFLAYGMLMGLATAVRLNFVLLPIVLSPIIFFREKSWKRACVLLAAMMIGQLLLLVPQMAMTKAYQNKWALSTRGVWHMVIQGLGAYPNPFGVRDTTDLFAMKWAVERGGPDINAVGIRRYDDFMKKESLRLFRERPDVFARNFRINFYDGLTMTPKYRSRYMEGPLFYGLMNEKEDAFDLRVNRYSRYFPWLVCLALLILYTLWRSNFWPMLAVTVQGLYFLCVLCVFFPPVDHHITAYYPVFCVLLGSSIGTVLRFGVSCVEAGVASWRERGGVQTFRSRVPICFRYSWDSPHEQGIPPETSDRQGPRRWKTMGVMVRWAGVALAAVLLIGVLLLANVDRVASKDQRDPRSAEIVRNILTLDRYGGFEEWENGVPLRWEFVGGGKARVLKESDRNNVVSGRSSAMIETSSATRSYLQFLVPNDQSYYLTGRAIRVSGWVKSNNKMPNGVSISIRDAVVPSRYAYAYYRNSGGWEKLTVSHTVARDSLGVVVYLNAAGEAGTIAYYDNVQLETKAF